MKIYLACPISGRTMEESNGWKEKWKEKFTCLDPCAGEIWEGNAPHRQDHGWQMFRTDKFKVQQSDVVVINLLNAPRISAGCCVEKGMADAWGKLVVLIMKRGSIHDIDMLTKGAILCENEIEAIGYLLSVDR